MGEENPRFEVEGCIPLKNIVAVQAAKKKENI